MRITSASKDMVVRYMHLVSSLKHFENKISTDHCIRASDINFYLSLHLVVKVSTWIFPTNKILQIHILMYLTNEKNCIRIHIFSIFQISFRIGRVAWVSSLSVKTFSKITWGNKPSTRCIILLVFKRLNFSKLDQIP